MAARGLVKEEDIDSIKDSPRECVNREGLTDE